MHDCHRFLIRRVVNTKKHIQNQKNATSAGKVLHCVGILLDMSELITGSETQSSRAISMAATSKRHVKTTCPFTSARLTKYGIHATLSMYDRRRSPTYGYGKQQEVESWD
jgi:hypothetical protein